MWYNYGSGRVAELVYAFDLKSNGENHTGSSPVSATISGLFSEISRSRALFIAELCSAIKNALMRKDFPESSDLVRLYTVARTYFNTEFQK